MIKKIFKGLFCHYLMWFGIYNIFITLGLCSLFNDDSMTIVLILLQVVDTYFIWYKKIYKNKEDATYLFGNVSQNNLLAIYGGIGTGKSTLANFILDKYCHDEELKYYNYYKKGYRCFTHDYLFLKKALPKGACVLIDEAGRTYDSFKSSYDKKNDKERARILAFNKFFRHWYTDKGLCIYIDQCEDNINTSLRKTVYYVIQCRGIQRKAMPLLFGALYVMLNSIFKWTSYNVFGLVDIDYIDFNKVGDYAEHYSINYDAKDVKHFIRPAIELFKNNDTYVFEKYNPCTYDPDEDYVWGDDEQTDSQLMNANFDFESFNENLCLTKTDDKAKS